MIIRGITGSLFLLAAGVLAWGIYSGVPLAGVPFDYALGQCVLHSRVEVEFLYGLLYLLPLLLLLLTVAAFTIYSNSLRVLLRETDRAGVVRSLVVIHGLMALFWLGLALVLPGTLESWAGRLEGALPFPGCDAIYDLVNTAPAAGVDDASLPSAQVAAWLQTIALVLAPAGVVLAVFDGLIALGLQTLLTPSAERLETIFPADETRCDLCGIVPLTASTAGTGCNLCHGRVRIEPGQADNDKFDAIVHLTVSGNLPLHAPLIRFDLPRRTQIVHLESLNGHVWNATDTSNEWRSDAPVQADRLGINLKGSSKPLRVAVRPGNSPSWSQWVTLGGDT